MFINNSKCHGLAFFDHSFDSPVVVWKTPAIVAMFLQVSFKEHFFHGVAMQSILTPLTFLIQLILGAMPSSFQGCLPAPILQSLLASFKKPLTPIHFEHVGCKSF